MPNINWDHHKRHLDRHYHDTGPPPIVAGNEHPFIILVTLHERVYWTSEAGRLQCSRPMVNCSVQHIGDHKRTFAITRDMVSAAAMELDSKVSKAFSGTMKSSMAGIGDIDIKGDLASVTGLNHKISEELKRHIGQEPEFELMSHAPPCYEIIAPFGAYAVMSIDGDAKVTRWFRWNATRAEIEWTNTIEMEPNPPFGYKVGFSAAFGLYEWAESNARKIRPCNCRGVDKFDDPPTAQDMHLGEDGRHKEGGEKPNEDQPKRD